jgi:O-antigen ligase
MEGFFIFDFKYHKRKMKNTLQIFLLSLYFFIFLLSESTLNLYLSWDRVNPQFLSLSILNTFSFIYLYKNNLLIESIRSSFKEKIILCYLIFILASLFSIFVADNISEAIVVFSKYSTYLVSFISIYSIARTVRKNFLAYFLIFSCIALFIESVSIVYNVIDRVIIEGNTFERDNFLLRTFAGNINISANSIVSKIMIVYLLIYTYNNKKILLSSYFLLFISFSALFILLTRTAFLSLALATVLIMAWNYKKFISRSLPILGILLIGYFFVKQNINTVNQDEIYTRIASTVNIQDDSINERLGYYRDASESIKEKPILGIGIGNWKIKSIKYAGQSVNGYTVPYHAHNDFLQLAAEIGLAGAAFYLMIYLIPFYNVFIKIKNKVLDNFNLIGTSIIFVIFIDSMLNFPIARPINHIFLIFTLVVLMLTSKSNFSNEGY